MVSLGTVFFMAANLNPQALLDLIKNEGYDLAEAFVTQYEALQALSLSGLNTMRITIQLNRNDEM